MRRSDITVTVYTFSDAGNLKAYADVTFRTGIGEITVRRFKVISTDAGHLWVATPQFEYRRFLGDAYVDAVVLPKRVFRRIQRLVLREYWKKVREKDSHV